MTVGVTADGTSLPYLDPDTIKHHYEISLTHGVSCQDLNTVVRLAPLSMYSTATLQRPPSLVGLNVVDTMTPSMFLSIIRQRLPGVHCES